NADTTIFYVQYGQRSVLSNPDADWRRRCGVLDGVAGEIVDHALDQRGVGADEESRFDRGVQHAVRACLEKRDARGNEVAEVYDGRRRGKVAQWQTFEIEQAGDHRLEF